MKHRSIRFITVTVAGRDMTLSPSDLHSAFSVTGTKIRNGRFFIPSLDSKLTEPDELHPKVLKGPVL